MQAFDREVLCMLLYANVSVKTRVKVKTKLYRRRVWVIRKR